MGGCDPRARQDYPTAPYVPRRLLRSRSVASGRSVITRSFSSQNTEVPVAKFSFLLGFGAGYVLGAKAGRERYEQITASARQLLDKPQVKRVVESAPGNLGARVEQVANTAADKVAQAGDRVSGGTSGATTGTTTTTTTPTPATPATGTTTSTTTPDVTTGAPGTPATGTTGTSTDTPSVPSAPSGSPGGTTGAPRGGTSGTGGSGSGPGGSVGSGTTTATAGAETGGAASTTDTGTTRRSGSSERSSRDRTKDS